MIIGISHGAATEGELESIRRSIEKDGKLVLFNPPPVGPYYCPDCHLELEPGITEDLQMRDPGAAAPIEGAPAQRPEAPVRAGALEGAPEQKERQGSPPSRRTAAGLVIAGPENLAELLALPEPPGRIWWEKAGMELVLVPAGEFIMGTPEEEVRRLHQRCGGELGWYLREVPRHRVHLSAYYIGRYAVTNEQYDRFVKGTGHRLPNLDPKENPWAEPYNWDWGQRTPPQGREVHPVVLVSWEDAVAYCRWAGLRLPTEAEWEKAARGADGRIYPWGDQWEAHRCNNAERLAGRPLRTYAELRVWLENWQREDPLERNQDTTTPVGRYSPTGDSPYGCADMAGNVWEWCADWHDGRYYRHSPLRDPQGPAAGTHHVLRGGAWGTDHRGVRCAYRYRLSPSDRSSHVGFRCAVSAGERFPFSQRIQ